MPSDKMDKDLKNVRRQAKDRRTSVLPDEASYQTTQVDEVWQIANSEQLSGWVQTRPDDVMDMIRDLRFERDQFLSVAVHYDSMKQQKLKMEQDLSNSQDLVDAAQAEADKYRNQILSLRQQMQQQRSGTPSSPSEGKNILEHSSQSSTKASRLSKGIPDPPLFTDGQDPTWDDWSSKIEQKLSVNQDHFPTQESQLAYVISRLGGKAITHTINRRRRGAVNPYISYNQILEQLAALYDDPGRESMAGIQYNALVQGSMSFREFYGEFIRLGDIANHADNMLLRDLPNKISIRLRDAMAIGTPKTASLRELRDFLMRVDDDYRARHEQKLIQKPSATTTTTSKTTDNSTKKASAYIVPARRVTSTITSSSTPLSKPKEDLDPSDLTCFNCGKTGHLRRDCPVSGQTDAGRKAWHEAKLHALETGEECDIDNLEAECQEESSDSGNE